MSRALLLLLLVATPGRALALDLELELGLYNRFTLVRNGVERLMRYDEAAAAFDTRGYHAPRTSETAYSFLASAGLYLEPTSWLGLGLAVDSGELRPVGFLPRSGEVRLTTPLSQIFPTLPVLTTANRPAVTASGQPIGDEARETFFVRQAFLRLAAPRTGWFSLKAGRLGTEVASSLVYNDYALGATLLAELDRLKSWPLRITAQALLPTRSWSAGLRSPLVELRLDYIFFSLLSLVESVGLSVSYFHDGDDNFAQLFHGSLAEVATVLQPRLDPDLHRDGSALLLSTGSRTSADLAWIGLDGRKLIGDLLLSATAVVEVGRLRLENPLAELARLAPSSKLTACVPKGETITLPTLGFALDLTARYLFSETISAGVFFLYLSGEDNPFLSCEMDRYSSFLGVLPYHTHTNLFFSGGMNETFSGRQATASGINARGVIAAGPSFTWEITETISAGVTAAALFSQFPSVSGGRVYGFEADLEGSWAITRFLKASLEYDLLATGSFFPTRAVVHKLLLGLDLSYEI